MKLFSTIQSIFKPRTDTENERIDERLIKIEVFDERPPEQLGIRPGVPGLSSLVQMLDEAFEKAYQQSNLKQRMRRSKPAIAYDWLLMEMKRVLIMSCILRNHINYSSDVDDFWIEMMAQTDEYEAFCTAFTGGVNQYQPYSIVTPMDSWESAENRALFDLVYSMLFTVHPANEYLHSSFFRNKANEEVFHTIEKYPNSFTINQYFNKSSGEVFKQIQEELTDYTRKVYLETKEMLRGEAEVPDDLPASGRFVQSIEPSTKEVDAVTAMLYLSSLQDLVHYRYKTNLEEGDIVINDRNISSYRAPVTFVEGAEEINRDLIKRRMYDNSLD
ncbi:hypothetical protein [Paenibacillus sp. Y412MC10]|uniref:hypothetical protein n=1 Tax=Geobacillus sp. (strain Y412MC10) TaxID=481743 RepID=UPI0011AB4B29|nr:hypothetical protein [Paenibacillus sp. Y412MC10]